MRKNEEVKLPKELTRIPEPITVKEDFDLGFPGPPDPEVVEDKRHKFDYACLILISIFIIAIFFIGMILPMFQ